MIKILMFVIFLAFACANPIWPSVHVRVSGVWKEIIEIHVRVSGVWKALSEGHFKTGGVYKKFFSSGGAVPPTMIAFFTSTPAAPWAVLNGVAQTPNLTTGQVILKCSNAEGAETGADTHGHTITGTVSNDTSITCWNQGVGVYGAIVHGHSGNHGHPAQSHIPPYLRLIPACGGDMLPSGAILFVDGAVPAGFTAYTALYNKFIKCYTSSGATGGATSHSHSLVGGTGYFTTLSGTGKGGDAVYRAMKFGISHSHLMSHIHSEANTNIPPWYGMIPIVSTGILAAIPSGVCAFFKGGSVPGGWTQYAARNNQFVQGKSGAGGSGGATTHIHSHSGNSSAYDASNPNSCMGAPGAPTSEHTTGGPHSHPLSGIGQHTGGVSVPKHRPMLFCKKD